MGSPYKGTIVFVQNQILDTQGQILSVELGRARMFLRRQGRSNKEVIKRKASAIAVKGSVFLKHQKSNDLSNEKNYC